MTRLFYTKSADHLAKKIKIGKGKFLISKFPDREIYVKVKEEVKNKKAVVLAATNPPAENLLELMFLLDALSRAGAKISLMITYFGYARQDQAELGEALSSQRICSWLNEFKLQKINVLHAHSSRLQQFLQYKDLIPYEFFTFVIKKEDVVIAPDKGAAELAKEISKICLCSRGEIKKIRSKGGIKLLSFRGEVRGKRAVLVDDMISTGSTVVKAAKLLKEKGAKEVIVVATHGVFAGDAVERLEKSLISKVYVTNSLPRKVSSKKIKIVDISGLLKKEIK